MSSSVDITPTPRILRTLGDIPFEIWQCFAELSDNSLDAFREMRREGYSGDDLRLDIHWSTESTAAKEREVIVEDNGPGMTLEQLQNAARAGFSSNDPIHNLGLFGMGFNIATARLGEETVFVSATKESPNWVGIRIDFSELVRTQSFAAPVVTIPKADPSEHGTKVIVRRLKDGVFSELKRKQSSIRNRLEVVYSPLLERDNTNFYLQGKSLRPHPHCVWGESRFVVRKGVKVHAIQSIDRDLGESWFDLSRNRYLSEDEGADYDVLTSKGETVPSNIVQRSRRLRGWIGIQRYSDTANFGIDFIRNGRKILVANKSIFGYENPDSGTFVSEYPVELGSTVGGRIVGELNVDYLIPTYQKNGFDTTDRAWQLTVEVIRGAGPILPKKRKALGYDGENVSPLGALVNAYRRPDPGTKNLSLRSGVAKEFLREFVKGNPAYIPDDKWYRAAQEADKEKGAPSTPVDPGDQPTDDIDDYGPPGQPDADPDGVPVSPETKPSLSTTSRDELFTHSDRTESLCGKYAYGSTPGFEVDARKAVNTQIKISGERVPFTVFQDGIELDFFYDESHPLLAEYPITPKQLLLQALAEKFSIRDHGLSINSAFLGLVNNHMNDERINVEVLKERAQCVLSEILDGLPKLLAHRGSKSLDVIQAVSSEEEQLATTLLDEAPGLLEAYQNREENAVQALAYISSETLIRLVEEMPEEFLDGKIFTLPYMTISIGDDKTKNRIRRTALDKIVTYLKDATNLLKGGGSPNKSELIRYSNTLTILEDRLA